MVNQDRIKRAVEILNHEVKERELYVIYQKDNGQCSDYSEMLLDAIKVANDCMELQIVKPPAKICVKDPSVDPIYKCDNCDIELLPDTPHEPDWSVYEFCSCGQK